MGTVAQTADRPVRGILVAGDFHKRVILASRAISNLELKKYSFQFKFKRSEVLFVDYMAEHLTTNGRAGIIVPEGIIFQSQGAYKGLRKMLIKNSLVAVISLPAGCFNPYSGVKTSILILDKALAKQSDTIGFFKVENDGFGLGAHPMSFAMRTRGRSIMQSALGARCRINASSLS